VTLAENSMVKENCMHGSAGGVFFSRHERNARGESMATNLHVFFSWKERIDCLFRLKITVLTSLEEYSLQSIISRVS